MRLVAVLLCGLVAPAAAAGRAQPLPATEPPMQVYLVRSAEAGCEPQCPEWIAAQGRIEEGSAARLRRVLRQLKDRKVPLLIDSNGGRVGEALEIGRLARASGLDVAVSRTELITCAAADASCRRQVQAERTRLGLPIADYAKCASACAFILAGGARRLVGPAAFVGVHQIRSYYVYPTVRRTYRLTPAGLVVSERRVSEKVIETRTPESTYAQVRRYFAEMGIGEAIMPLILSTPGDRLRWLTRGELQATRLATDWIEGERLLSVVSAPSQPMVAPGAGDAGSGAAPVEIAPPE
jgi:hypothetical protein